MPVALLSTGTSTFLKIRWWVGTGLLATPTLAVSLWYSSPAPSALLPKDAVVHIIVAWAVGGLMAYLSDWTRRCEKGGSTGTHMTCWANSWIVWMLSFYIQSDADLQWSVSLTACWQYRCQHNTSSR